QAIGRHILARHGGDVGALLAQERATLRAELLALPRIGPETADTIMLYAGDHPVFIVDAYTRRLFARLDLAPGFDFTRARYDAVQALIESALTPWEPTTDHRPPANHQRPTDDQPTTTNHQRRPISVRARYIVSQRPTTHQRPPTTDQRPTTDHRPPTNDESGTQNSKLKTQNLAYSRPDGSLRHFLWDLHALIIEE